MSTLNLAALRRVLTKPSSEALHRVRREAGAEIDRLSVGRRAWPLDTNALLRATGADTLNALWFRLATRPYPFATAPVDLGLYEEVCPGDTDRILTLAERAAAHEVELLGSTPTNLGSTIDWLADYRTGHSWPPAFMRDIECHQPGAGGDARFPWEVSRLQWLIPAGQAFLLTGEERYASEARDVIDTWIAQNPYAGTVNWASTMETAMRIVSWSWFFHVFARSESWSNEAFRARFLSTLFLHGRFTARYRESEELSGVADATGLVFAGLFFGEGAEPARWLHTGWTLLETEIAGQITPDGIGGQGSTSYQRLVLELFLYPARYAGANGMTASDTYRQRIAAMARFVAAYSRRDGTSPLWGDAAAGRLLPLGGQDPADHRYLVGLVALLGDDTLLPYFNGPKAEIFWAAGEEGVRRLARVRRLDSRSGAFRDGGCFVMRNDRDHVFIDCAAAASDGSHGRGHNDCLSFEAQLDGVPLVADCGADVGGISPADRNWFRTSTCHNTPRIDGEEINRFLTENHWQLRNDAVPDVREWRTTRDHDLFVGSHSGYERLDPSIRPVRTIELNHREHALLIQDRFEGDGRYSVEIPLHLAPQVHVQRVGPFEVRLIAGDKRFRLMWTTPGWQVALEGARISPRYGVTVSSRRLVWRGRTGSALSVVIQPDARTTLPV